MLLCLNVTAKEVQRLLQLETLLISSGFMAFPANFEVDGILAVGASDRYDLQAAYSSTSDSSSPENQIIDIVTPSHSTSF